MRFPDLGNNIVHLIAFADDDISCFLLLAFRLLNNHISELEYNLEHKLAVSRTSNSFLLKYFFISLIAISALFAFLIAMAICWTHCSLESKRTPRTPIVVLEVIAFPSMFNVTGAIRNIQFVKNKAVPYKKTQNKHFSINFNSIINLSYF